MIQLISSNQKDFMVLSHQILAKTPTIGIFMIMANTYREFFMWRTGPEKPLVWRFSGFSWFCSCFWWRWFCFQHWVFPGAHFQSFNCAKIPRFSSFSRRTSHFQNSKKLRELRETGPFLSAFDSAETARRRTPVQCGRVSWAGGRIASLATTAEAEQVRNVLIFDFWIE